ncbi:hypothetical protein BST81_07240 [Leptolyngbya sp. 'hensonii']|uniref:CAAD domain-containing protein n=1 Tax=Leptolyngbya sp. 'hensonii' TaxID=1922337 RepID=UPI00094F792E|nr:CAAD domain-containing protein [Leptolyngbya sp. 'hensonii']OLP19011.1 hypothetical protein BST81_07240 [Leptolyngbya sp. 'hensonii']
MNPELQQTEYSDGISPHAETAKAKLDNNAGATESGTTGLLPSAESGQWQQIGLQMFDFFKDLANYLGAFIKEKPLTAVGLFLLAAVSVKLTLAVLNALNDLPLVAPTLELIGIGYVTWFTFRYLWKAASRQELIEQIQSLKGQIVGDDE